MPHDDKSIKPFSHVDNISKFQTVALSNKTGQGGFG